MVNVKVDTKSTIYNIDDCDSAFYDKESDSVKIMKGRSMIMIPYREVLLFRVSSRDSSMLRNDTMRKTEV